MPYERLDLISRFGQFALQKSRRYYYPRTINSLMRTDEINDVAFSVLLKEIDTFAAQFRAPARNSP